MPTNLVSQWTQSLSRHERPSDADLRDHLMTVHRAHAGFTESCAIQCRDRSGLSSYEFLAEVVDPSLHRCVLDLACGSGVLLEICHRRCGSGTALIGLDMSFAELDLARKRNPDPAIELHQGIAQDLGIFVDSKFDVILCHQALTLMDQVPQVLAEIRRVLKPGGIFAAIVDGDPASAPGYPEVHKTIYDLVQVEHPDYATVDLGDPRVRASKDLKQLVYETFEDANIKIEPAVFELYASPSALAREAAGFFYASFVLSDQTHRQMLEDLELLFAVQPSEPSRFALPVNRLTVTAGINS